MESQDTPTAPPREYAPRPDGLRARKSAQAIAKDPDMATYLEQLQAENTLSGPSDDALYNLLRTQADITQLETLILQLGRMGPGGDHQENPLERVAADLVAPSMAELFANFELTYDGPPVAQQIQEQMQVVVHNLEELHRKLKEALVYHALSYHKKFSRPKTSRQAASP